MRAVRQTIGPMALAAALLASAGTGPTAAAEDGAEHSDRQSVEASQKLVLGLDGAAYRSYKTSVIEWVQKELAERDLYKGEINGRLDEETKKAIAEFQEQNGVRATGIPSPLTRKALREEDEQSRTATG